MSKGLKVLKDYLSDLTTEEREALARACGTTWGHLRNISYGDRRCSAELAIALERETHGKLTCEKLCPEADWKYLRNSVSPQTAASTR